MWAMRRQRRHGRRWLGPHREVRATLSAPFYVNKGSRPLRKHGHVHANLLGGLTVDDALDHRYRSTRSLSSLRLARECFMALTISTGACDVSSCVRFRDLASNRGGRAVGRDNRSTRFTRLHSCRYRVPPARLMCRRASVCGTSCGTAVDGRWNVLTQPAASALCRHRRWWRRQCW